MADELLTEREGTVLARTLNRPHPRNAIDLPPAQAPAAALDGLDADPGLPATSVER